MHKNNCIRKLELLCRNIFKYVEIYDIIKVYTKRTNIYRKYL